VANEWVISTDPPPFDQRGSLEGTIRFPDGCEPHIELYVNLMRLVRSGTIGTVTAAGTPTGPFERYKYHLQDRWGQCIVRFDNWPHHPQLPTAPHHIHVGSREQVRPHPCPSARQIVRRVLSYHGGHA